MTGLRAGGFRKPLRRPSAEAAKGGGSQKSQELAEFRMCTDGCEIGGFITTIACKVVGDGAWNSTSLWMDFCFPVHTLLYINLMKRSK